MGTTDRFVKTNETLVLKVSKIVIPKTYNPEAYKDDVAVMLLKGSVPKNYRFIEPIEMNNHAVKTGTLCNVTGWGSMKEAVSFMTINKFINTKKIFVGSNAKFSLNRGRSNCGYSKLSYEILDIWRFG